MILKICGACIAPLLHKGCGTTSGTVCNRYTSPLLWLLCSRERTGVHMFKKEKLKWIKKSKRNTPISATVSRFPEEISLYLSFCCSAKAPWSPPVTASTEATVFSVCDTAPDVFGLLCRMHTCRERICSASFIDVTQTRTTPNAEWRLHGLSHQWSTAWKLVELVVSCASPEQGSHCAANRIEHKHMWYILCH